MVLTPSSSIQDLIEIAKKDERLELVEGVLTPMAPVDLIHGRVHANLFRLLDNHAHQRLLGHVVSEVGFTLKRDPDSVLAPDLAFIEADRYPEEKPGFVELAPDLIVEIISPGNVLGVGRMRREPPPWLVRQVRHRDRECRFPGCGSRRFTEAHHIVFWRNGGTTDLDNLVLICSFHHRLVHELGWSLAREAGGALTWFRPGGVPYRPGPSSRAGPSPRGPTG